MAKMYIFSMKEFRPFVYITKLLDMGKSKKSKASVVINIKNSYDIPICYICITRYSVQSMV